MYLCSYPPENRLDDDYVTQICNIRGFESIDIARIVPWTLVSLPVYRCVLHALPSVGNKVDIYMIIDRRGQSGERAQSSLLAKGPLSNLSRGLSCDSDYAYTKPCSFSTSLYTFAYSPGHINNHVIKWISNKFFDDL